MNIKNKNLQETQISTPKRIEHQIFLDVQLQPLQVLILNFKETVCPKNI